MNHPTFVRNKPLSLPMLLSCLWLLGPGGGALQAMPPEELFARANEVYGQGRYQEAATLYDSVLAQGLVSPSLYFNLGNAYYQQGRIAPAILHYERALKLDPGHDDAAFNLRLAHQRVVDNIEPEPEFVLTRWWSEGIEGRSSDAWGRISLGLMWLALGGVALLLFGQGTGVRRAAFVGTLGAGLLALAALGLAHYQDRRAQAEHHAIVMSANAYVKNAPDGPTDLLILHEGVKVELLDEVDGWSQIRLAGANLDEVEGFIRSENLEAI
jgi:tetratricopeptide (TPR) repeat protein